MQDNQDRHTTGIDGLSSLKGKERLELAGKILQNPYDKE